jgi:hypothetical protein
LAYVLSTLQRTCQRNLLQRHRQRGDHIQSFEFCLSVCTRSNGRIVSERRRPRTVCRVCGRSVVGLGRARACAAALATKRSTMSGVRVRVLAADDDPANPGVEVELPVTPSGWGREHTHAVAEAVGVDSQSAFVSLRFADGVSEGRLPTGRSGWRMITGMEPGDVLVVCSGAAAAPAPRVVAPTASLTVLGGNNPRSGEIGQPPAASSATTSTPIPGPSATASVQAAPSTRSVTHASSYVGAELPVLSEEERNWKRIHALFLDEPCPVPRTLQQVSH